MLIAPTCGEIQKLRLGSYDETVSVNGNKQFDQQQNFHTPSPNVGNY